MNPSSASSSLLPSAGITGVTGRRGPSPSALTARGITGLTGRAAPAAAAVPFLSATPALPVAVPSAAQRSPAAAVVTAAPASAPPAAAAALAAECPSGLSARAIHDRPPMYPFAHTEAGKQQWAYLNGMLGRDALQDPTKYPSGCTSSGRSALSGVPNPPFCPHRVAAPIEAVHYTPSGGIDNDWAFLFPHQQSSCPDGQKSLAFRANPYAEAYPTSVAGSASAAAVDARAAQSRTNYEADLKALQQARAATLSDAAVAKPRSPQGAVSLEGSLIDLTCYARGGRVRPHQACAAQCARKGMPVGLLEGGQAGNPTYVLLAPSHELSAHMNKQVRVTGSVAGEDVAAGAAVHVDKLEVKNASTGKYEPVA